MKAFFMPTSLVRVFVHTRTHTHTHAHTRTHTHIHTGNKTWYVQNQVGLRKKSNGPGCHVSAFVGHVLGFGMRGVGGDTDNVLKRCNQVRKDQKSAVDNKPKVKLSCNPAIRCLFFCCLSHGVRALMFAFACVRAER